MAGDTDITVVGNITADPELRITATGLAVATFTVASSRRIRDGEGRWSDGPTLFLRVTVWRMLAENVAESLTKGARVVVNGRLRQHSYQARDGRKRTAWDIDARDVAPSLRFATAVVAANPVGDTVAATV